MKIKKLLALGLIATSISANADIVDFTLSPAYLATAIVARISAVSVVITAPTVASTGQTSLATSATSQLNKEQQAKIEEVQLAAIDTLAGVAEPTDVLNSTVEELKKNEKLKNLSDEQILSLIATI